MVVHAVVSKTHGLFQNGVCVGTQGDGRISLFLWGQKHLVSWVGLEVAV